MESVDTSKTRLKKIVENQYFQQFFNLSSDGIVLVDDENFIAEWNPALENITGVSRCQVLGNNVFKVFTSLVPPEQHSDIQTFMDEIRKEETSSICQPLKTTFRHLNGRLCAISIYAFPIQTEERTYIAVMAIKSNEQGQIQEKLIEQIIVQNDRLILLGELATGIVQEINSPLQVVTGVSESIIDRIRKTSTISKKSLTESKYSEEEGHLLRQMEMMNRSAWRMAEALKALAQFGSDISEELMPYDLNSVIKNARLLIEAQLRLRSNEDLKLELMPNLPMIFCNPWQVGQLLIRLVINACDSMVDGGTVTIRTGMGKPYLTSVPSFSSVTRRNEYKEDMRVYLQVSDTGRGIPKEMQMAIYDPFSTADPREMRTRLGLAVVAAIARLHGAEITMESEPKKGTTFVIYFQRL